MKTTEIRISAEEVSFLLDLIETEEARARTQIHVEDGEYSEQSQRHWIWRLEKIRQMKRRVSTWRARLR